ncbi:MAG: DUF1858 domain-containing protein [bacterium]|nr:DUF1858 domain-containing protein [bacterium]
MNESTTILMLVERYPQTIPILLKYGIQCIGCKHSAYETLKDAARFYGITELANIIRELQDILNQSASNESDLRPKRILNNQESVIKTNDNQ